MRVGAVLVVVMAALGPGIATCQAQVASGGTITGVVRDESGAVLPQAVVEVSSDALIGGRRPAAIAAGGVYRAAALPPGTYAVTARSDGFQPLLRSDVAVVPGGVVVLDLTLSPAGVREQVVIEARAPMIDVRTAAAPFHIDQHFLFALPVSRAFDALINLVPGIQADVAFGGSQRSNALFVDGVSATDPLYQDPNARVSHNWIQEVHVVGLGAPAEFGGFTGVAANTILRSGSNRLAGLAEYWTTRPEWVARNTGHLSRQLQRDFAPREISSWWELNAHVGGPIAPNRLWYFGGVQALRHDDRPAGFSGPGHRQERQWQALVKPTVALSSSARLDGHLERGRTAVDGENIGAFAPIESSHDTRRPQTGWTARVTHSDISDLLVELRHSGSRRRAVEDPHHPNTRLGPAPRFEDSTFETLVNAPYFFTQDSREQTTAGTVARYLAGAAGAHDLKAGVEHGWTRAETTFGIPGGRAYFTNQGVAYAMQLWDGDRASADTHRVALFVQDLWALPWRLTLSPGVRIDVNRGSVPSRDNAFATTPVSPRLGVAWDVAGTHRTVARAHFGRYHDTIFSSRIAAADVSGSSPNTFGLLIGDTFLPLSTVTPAPIEIDARLRHSGMDQYVLAVEHEVGRDLALTAQFIARNFNRFMGLVDRGSAFTPVQRPDPGADGRLGTPDDGAPITVFDLTNPGAKAVAYTNPPDAFNRYRAVQFVARKRLADAWQAQASYTWSRNEGTVGNRWHVNAARFDLGDPGRFVNPNGLINAYGRAHIDPTHEAKILGTVRLPVWGGVALSGVYRHATGQAWGRRVRVGGLRQGPENIRIEPVGTRRTPPLNRLDLRVEKIVPVAGGRSLGVFVEAFNLGNQGVPDADVTNAIQEMSGAAFGQPLAWTDPRTVRAAIRLRF